LRIRPAEFKDGNFEEVRTTQNASSRGFYFMTPLDCYVQGMRVKIVPATGSFADSAAWQDTGEVVRVEHETQPHGIAVHLSAHGQRSANASSAQSEAPSEETRPADSERRRAARTQFFAAAEVLDARTGSRIVARTSDLSMRGCYIDTMNPQPVGTTIRLVVQREGEIIDVPASVRSRILGSGMGLEFAGINAAQRSTIENWLSGSSVVAPPEPMPTLLGAEKSEQASEPQQGLAARLLQTLVRKGLLNQSEASALLGDSEI
jgi:hypothetical protein